MNRKAILIVGITIISILLLRLPFISNLLIDEEGIFAYLVVGEQPLLVGNNADAPVILGRLLGNDKFGLSEHPLPPYLFMDNILRLISTHADLQNLSVAEKSVAARMPFLCAFVIGLIGLIIIGGWMFQAKDYSRVFLACLIIGFVASSPLMVGGSIQPQVEGGIGIAIISGVACLIICAAKYRGSRISFVLLLAAGILSAMGKNEWALSMLMATVISLSFYLVGKRCLRWDECHLDRWPLQVSICLTAGLSIGSLLSYSLSPENYLGGLYLMQRVAQHKLSVFEVFLRNLKWVYPLLVLLLICGIGFVRLVKRMDAIDFSLAVVYLWGCGLGLGYFLAPWTGDYFPRYFLPSMFALLCFAVAAFERVTVSSRGAKVCTAVLLFGISANLVTLYSYSKESLSITSYPGTPLITKEIQYLVKHREFLRSHQPVVVDAAFGYYFPDDDFIGQGLGEDGIKHFLSKFTEQRRR